MSETNSPTAFSDLGLPSDLLAAIDRVGYESPSPIQAATIPALLAGDDVIGRAQTGTGKTAAFALPILARLSKKKPRAPQALVLAPTRELAIQVAEAFATYASAIKDFQVVPIYGGQDYNVQRRQLDRGVHVVVGTPGRVMDLMRSGSLDLGILQTLVLDEADEMLRMGFIEDVEWVLTQTPESHQIALFSATMPDAIKRIAETYLRDPRQITIREKTATAATVHQRYWLVSGLHKLDAMTRILEAEPYDGVIVFVRTKTATVELADRLAARGMSTAALNGDVSQKLREQTIDKLKKGHVDILVATDVAARGLDVERITHVINYDIPYDTEAYVHRIGRTGRAGRSGHAILFVAPRERRMLRTIERATGQIIEPMDLPTAREINDLRIKRFYEQIDAALIDEEMDFYRRVVQNYIKDQEIPAMDVAAALVKISQGDQSLLIPERKPEPRQREFHDQGKPSGKGPRERKPKKNRDDDIPRESFRVEVGHDHGVKPGNIVGAIANEAGVEGRHIGRVDIQDTYSIVDLPVGMPKEIFRDLKKVRVVGRPLAISRVSGPRQDDADRPARPPKPRKAAKPGKPPKAKKPRKPKPHRKGKKPKA